MIKVLIKEEDKKITIKIKGHANSAEHGKDLVCASVSAVVTAAFNSIKNIDSFNLIFEEGNALLESKGMISSHDGVVIETLINGLKAIEETQSKYIKIIMN